MDMDVKKVDMASVEVDALVRKELQRPAKAVAGDAVSKPDAQAAQDKVEINSATSDGGKIESLNPRAGNIYNYTVDS